MPCAHVTSIGIVDDDCGARQSLTFLLESEGYEVVSFTSGADLLTTIPAFDPDCLIIDFKMPGMDGLDLCRRLRALGSETPVVLMTGHPGRFVRVEAQKVGLPLVEKPLEQELLLRAVLAARASRCRNC